MSDAVQGFCGFCDASAAQHIHDHRDHHISLYPETPPDTAIEPLLWLPDSIGLGPECKGLVELGVEAFHRNANQFTRYHHPAPQEGQP